MLKLLMYDIENDKARARLAKYLERQGMERLQYSVFAGDLEYEHWENIHVHLDGFFAKYCRTQDKVYAITVSISIFKKMKAWGQKVDTTMLLNEIDTLYL